MSSLLYLKVLEGYNYQFRSCTFTSNTVSNSPIFVIDNASVALVATPTSVNFLIQDTTFTSNRGSDNAGSFKIMSNAWLNM